MSEKGQRNKGRFVKGESGNPSGRPVIDPAFKKLAEEKSLSALKTLIAIYENKENQKKRPLVAIEAAKVVISYGIGKPVETIKADVEHSGTLILRFDAEDKNA